MLTSESTRVTGNYANRMASPGPHDMCRMICAASYAVLPTPRCRHASARPVCHLRSILLRSIQLYAQLAALFTAEQTEPGHVEYTLFLDLALPRSTKGQGRREDVTAREGDAAAGRGRGGGVHDATGRGWRDRRATVPHCGTDRAGTWVARILLALGRLPRGRWQARHRPRAVVAIVAAVSRRDTRAEQSPW